MPAAACSQVTPECRTLCTRYVKFTGARGNGRQCRRTADTSAETIISHNVDNERIWNYRDFGQYYTLQSNGPDTEKTNERENSINGSCNAGQLYKGKDLNCLAFFLFSIFCL